MLIHCERDGFGQEFGVAEGVFDVVREPRCLFGDVLQQKVVVLEESVQALLVDVVVDDVLEGLHCLQGFLLAFLLALCK